MPSLAASSAFSVSTTGDLVQKIKEGDFSDLETLVSKLSVEQYEMLGDYLVEMFHEMDKSMLTYWCAKKQCEMAESGDDIFGKKGFYWYIIMRTSYSDTALIYWRTIFEPFIKEVEKAAAEKLDISSSKGRKKVCSIVSVYLDAYKKSIPDRPIFMRRTITAFHEKLGKGNGLDPVFSVMNAPCVHHIANPALLGFLDEAPQGRRADIYNECSRIFLAISNQTAMKEEPYASFITQHNESLNRFAEELYSKKVIDDQVRGNRPVYNEQNRLKSELRLRQYLDGLRDGGESSENSSETFDERMTQEMKAQLEVKVKHSNWKASKKEEGITFWKWNGEDDGVCVKVDGYTRGKLPEVTASVENIFFGEAKDRSNLINERVSSNLSSISYIKKLPFPFSGRFMSINSLSSVEEKESHLYFTNNTHSEVPSGSVHAKIYTCGAHLTVERDQIHISMVFHFDTKGKLPGWVMGILRKSAEKKMVNAIKFSGQSQGNIYKATSEDWKEDWKISIEREIAKVPPHKQEELVQFLESIIRKKNLTSPNGTRNGKQPLRPVLTSSNLVPTRPKRNPSISD
eukprot:TRINITY_DN87_c0_g1_i2.p1 TRINITY_DN87_c0_g1~~TRINITY_DN87_c0_g1_i2.p1  ORF type:complete len:571 (-),score=169.97 TRINITY_DN87_c0_g1_i2:208-1920(-)